MFVALRNLPPLLFLARSPSQCPPSRRTRQRVAMGVAVRSPSSSVLAMTRLSWEHYHDRAYESGSSRRVK
jgi:hypothetical protein